MNNKIIKQGNDFIVLPISKEQHERITESDQHIWDTLPPSRSSLNLQELEVQFQDISSEVRQSKTKEESLSLVTRAIELLNQLKLSWS